MKQEETLVEIIVNFVLKTADQGFKFNVRS